MLCEVFEALLIAATASVVLAFAIPQLEPFLYYGKVQDSKKVEVKSLTEDPIRYLTQVLTVPKSHFKHFYILSSALCTVIIALAVPDLSIISPRALLVLVLVSVHNYRRLFESFLVERLSKNSRIQLPHYIAGVVFYLSQCVFLSQFLSDDDNSQLSAQETYLILVLYLVSTAVQFHAHHHLASLKKYSLPQAGLFKLVACPHYLAEIGIYTAIALASKTPPSVVTLFWVIVNLGASANQTQLYYSQVYGNGAPKWAIIPLVI
uniref:Polyprenal reductase n=1 Tax=Blastobotrys adeninivorans TaxID=409370 RepID=A0A060TFF6_BLAAD